MTAVTIWHNPNCSTSRHAMETAADMDVDITARRYLSDSPTQAELLEVLSMLEDPPADLVRQDAHFAELGLRADDYQTPEQVAELLSAEPRLIQRPVLIRSGRAIIGRPKDRVQEFLSD